MNLEEQIDPDEILRDVGDILNDTEALDGAKDVRELNFGTRHDQNANFSDISDDLDNA
jgi:hypothetical protein